MSKKKPNDNCHIILICSFLDMFILLYWVDGVCVVKMKKNWCLSKVLVCRVHSIPQHTEGRDYRTINIPEQIILFNLFPSIYWDCLVIRHHLTTDAPCIRFNKYHWLQFLPPSDLRPLLGMRWTISVPCTWTSTAPHNQEWVNEAQLMHQHNTSSGLSFRKIHHAEQDEILLPSGSK